MSAADAVEHESVLWMLLSAAASSGFVGREDMLDARWQRDIGLQVDPRVSAVLRVAWRGENQDLGEWVGISNELGLYRAAMDDMVQRMRAPEAPRKLKEKLKSLLPAIVSQQSLCASATQSVRSVLIAIHSDRLAKLAVERGLTDVASRVDELREASRYRGDEVGAAFTALNETVCQAVLGARVGSAPVPAEELNRHKALLEEYVDRYDRVGLNLCLDVAASIEMDDAGIEQSDAGEIWRAMLDTADVVAEYKACVMDLCETVRSSIPPRSAMLTAPVVASPARAAPSRSMPKRRKPGKRAAAPSATALAPPAAPVDSRTPAQRNADALLKRWPVDLATTKRLDADVIAVGRTLGKDTSTAEKLLNDARYDAVRVADFLTASARDWFGESDRVRQVQASLSERDDGDRIAQLADRLDALKLIEQNIKMLEADALKRDPLPRATHLSRLLSSEEIASVGAPVRLQSAGDTGESGELFEIAIRPKRLSDGRHAAPWFVHLHTSEPVASQALFTMEFGVFTAVHLKTAAQKKLGRNWEEAMRAWGHTEAKVHRAAIGPALLQELFARVRPSMEDVTEAATSSMPRAREPGASAG
ncbi:type III effector protein XopP [Paraburkholderia sp. NMBU_R16]|uniref:type III effector protein XopP n=1 Tax=Paraburkholderia sp. NMBU_R16 TaxID=2698676 RepID=UPI001565DAF7|nr:type III effector protein XopP [Paraburkholderia sp. NMBU_R16]NRO94344.1 type III effector protein XopP [Paraburkholderia sp. NMBU_R16]